MRKPHLPYRVSNGGGLSVRNGSANASARLGPGLVGWLKQRPTFAGARCGLAARLALAHLFGALLGCVRLISLQVVLTL